MRKTVHLIASEDAGWMLPLFAAAIVPWSRRRLSDLGFEPAAQARALKLIHDAVDRDGPLTRPELLRRLTDSGFDSATEVKYHLWTLATLDGELCLGPDRGGQTCLVRTEEWIGRLEPRPREESLGELARRYLRAYGPATDRDLARWAGLPLRDAREGIERIAPQVDQLDLGENTLLTLGRPPRPSRGRVVRFLGAYDNYNLAYESRDFAVPATHLKQLAPGGGIIRPAITVDGAVVGTWSSKRTGERLAVSLEPFGALEPELADAVAAEVADVGRFEDLTARLV
jgi:Winged helix DNA-binding domain